MTAGRSPSCPLSLSWSSTISSPSARSSWAVCPRRGSRRSGGLYGCKAAVLKERSPSCGSGEVYDGTFSGRLTPGDGVTAALLKANGIAVYGESDLDALLAQPEPPVEEDAQRSLF